MAQARAIRVCFWVDGQIAVGQTFNCNPAFELLRLKTPKDFSEIMAPQLKEDKWIQKHFASQKEFLQSVQGGNLDLLATVAFFEYEELLKREAKAKNQDPNLDKYREAVIGLLAKNGQVPNFIYLASPKFKLDNNLLKLAIVSPNEVTYRNYSKSITIDNLNLSPNQVSETKRRMDAFEVMHAEMPSARSSDTHHLPTPEELARVDAELETLKGQKIVIKGKPVLRCPRDGCHQSFTAFPSLNKHLKSQHYGIAEFPCPLCDVPFTRQNSLEYHMLCHFKIQLFQCHVCQEEFRHQQHFKTHLSKKHGINSVEAVDKADVSISELILLAIDVFNTEGGANNEILGKFYGQWRQWLNGQGAKPVKIKREIPAVPMKIRAKIQEVPFKINREIPVPVPSKIKWKVPEIPFMPRNPTSTLSVTPLVNRKRKNEENIDPQAKVPKFAVSHKQAIVTSQAPPPPPDAKVWVEATHRMPQMVVPRADEGLMSRVPLAARTGTSNGIRINFSDVKSFY